MCMCNNKNLKIITVYFTIILWIICYKQQCTCFLFFVGQHVVPHTSYTWKKMEKKKENWSQLLLCNNFSWNHSLLTNGEKQCFSLQRFFVFVPAIFYDFAFTAYKKNRMHYWREKLVYMKPLYDFHVLAYSSIWLVSPGNTFWHVKICIVVFLLFWMQAFMIAGCLLNLDVLTQPNNNLENLWFGPLVSVSFLFLDQSCNYHSQINSFFARLQGLI